ncbi:hypothetical protein E6H36_00575 [Candidatus Bathyarchaeota archaeon]|nr:MAG: hypothetical protein E6H36_00575 [Candidatus Bathyarchaeota archaeon]TMI33210.1 MAG: hypothetical protein E6H29_01135 [Candidatus Bathyarchaeota archaeon]
MAAASIRSGVNICQLSASRDHILHHHRSPRRTCLCWAFDDRISHSQRAQGQVLWAWGGNNPSLRSILALCGHRLDLPVPALLSHLREKGLSVRVYIIVFAVLIGVTAGELELINLPNLARDFVVTTLIGLAVAKAALVVLFFQELKDEPRPLSIVLVVAVVIVTALLSVSFLQLHPFHT